MQDSSSLILSVARGGESGKRGEEEIAIGDEVRRRDGVGEDVGRASLDFC